MATSEQIKALWRDPAYRERMMAVKRRGKHGFARSSGKDRFYRIYRGIRARCNNAKEKCYRNYGGRGIKNEWASFGDFRNDMHDSYLAHVKAHGEENTQIDRIDNDGNYSKKNCRWVTPKEQYGNMRRSLLVTYKGKTQCVGDWANEYGLKHATLKGRLEWGWTIEDALTKPVGPYKPH